MQETFRIDINNRGLVQSCERISFAILSQRSLLIGSENSVKVMSDSAIVFKQIKKDGKTIGAIGVVGPRRMDYARVLATLNELSDNISDLIEDKRLLTENGGESSAGGN